MVITRDERNTPAKIARPLSLARQALLIAIEMLLGAANQVVLNPE